MARSVDPKFYKSSEWKKTRNAYLQAFPLCENCLLKSPAEYNPSKYVHHIVELNADNVNDPTIALSFNNLKALCFNCHEEMHGRKVNRRYNINENGEVKIK